MGETRRVRDLVVRDKRPFGVRTVELLLCDPDGGKLPRWPAGAHIDLLLPHQLIRPYSLAGDPSDTAGWRLLIRRPSAADSREAAVSASAYVRDVLAVGDRVRARGPYDRFRLAGAPAYLFLASGAGIAPLLPMARLIQAARVYPWSLIHVDRTAGSDALRAEVLSLGPDVSVQEELDFDAILTAAAPGTAVYVCGPSRFVTATEVAAQRTPHVQMHRQRFDAAAPRDGNGRPCNIVLARRGEHVHVDAGTPVLTALLNAGVDVPYACGAGICGACAVRVIDGPVDHRDSILTKHERDGGAVIITCVSRASGDGITLDL
ncbi:PDR/VanB family oxidoreductase [uncultured Streptomyces sp.]|uniref:PDR/VanB family oxidoreductase n=1 Tax=uncultured Streptomyces sp. TaxID=174707 RepID=UPI002628B883|nr:PDR/VanB family oxidoreductase [uncultured Streptomyces sp.]